MMATVFFLHGTPRPRVLVEYRQRDALIRAKDQVDDGHRRGHGHQGQGHGVFDPVQKGNFHSGEFLQKGRGNHAPAAPDKRSHTAATARKGQGNHHEPCRIGMGTNIGSLHQGNHGHDPHGHGRGIVHEARSQAQADAENHGEPDHGGAGPSNHRHPEPAGQARLVQGDGEDQAAHDEHDHRVHIRGPCLLDIADTGQHQKNADADGRNLQRDRLDDKQGHQHGQHGQEPLPPGREAVYVIHLYSFQIHGLGPGPQIGRRSLGSTRTFGFQNKASVAGAVF